MNKNPRDCKAYRQKQKALKQRAKKLNMYCHLCRFPIDYTLPYWHKNAFTADHVQPIAKGGKVLGALKPAHRSCNSKKGDRFTEIKTIEKINTLNDW